MASRFVARIVVLGVLFFPIAVAMADHYCSQPAPTGTASIVQLSDGTKVVRVEHQNTGRIDVHLGDWHYDWIEFPGQPWQSRALPQECLTEPLPVRVVLTNCLGQQGYNQHRTELSAGALSPLDHTPTVQVTAQDASSTANSVQVKWKLLNTTSGWMKVEYRDMNGQVTTLSDGAVSGGEGSTTYLVNGGPGIVLATVTSCSGRFVASDSAHVLQRACTDCNNNCDRDCRAHPIRTSNGNARFTEIDPIPGAEFLPFRRLYDSRIWSEGSFGRGWTSLFDGRLIEVPIGTNPAAYVALTTDDGMDYVFRHSGSTYQQIVPAAGNEPALLVKDSATEWTLTENRGQLARRYVGGRLTTFIDRSTGREITIGYDGSGNPATVSDSFTRWSWTITYDAVGRRII